MSTAQASYPPDMAIPVPVHFDGHNINIITELTNTSLPKQKDRQTLYKTELCREWTQSGWCYYGKKCSFAHGLQELRPVFRSKKWRTKRCRNWHTQGYCPYEHRCQFLHDQPTPRHGSDSEGEDEDTSSQSQDSHIDTHGVEGLHSASPMDSCGLTGAYYTGQGPEQTAYGGVPQLPPQKPLPMDTSDVPERREVGDVAEVKKSGKGEAGAPVGSGLQQQQESLTNQGSASPYPLPTFDGQSPALVPVLPPVSDLNLLFELKNQQVLTSAQEYLLKLGYDPGSAQHMDYLAQHAAQQASISAQQAHNATIHATQAATIIAEASKAAAIAQAQKQALEKKAASSSPTGVAAVAPAPPAPARAPAPSGTVDGAAVEIRNLFGGLTGTGFGGKAGSMSPHGLPLDFPFPTPSPPPESIAKADAASLVLSNATEFMSTFHPFPSVSPPLNPSSLTAPLPTGSPPALGSILPDQYSLTSPMGIHHMFGFPTGPTTANLTDPTDLTQLAGFGLDFAQLGLLSAQQLLNTQRQQQPQHHRHQPIPKTIHSGATTTVAHPSLPPTTGTAITTVDEQDEEDSEVNSQRPVTAIVPPRAEST